MKPNVAGHFLRKKPLTLLSYQRFCSNSQCCTLHYTSTLIKPCHVDTGCLSPACLCWNSLRAAATLTHTHTPADVAKDLLAQKHRDSLTDTVYCPVIFSNGLGKPALPQRNTTSSLLPHV